MRRTRERLVSVLVVVAIVVSGVVTLALLGDARRSGLDALRDSKISEVEATARGFNQRQINQINGAQSFLSGQDYDFTESGDDQAKLDELLAVFSDFDLRTGWFLVNPAGVITAGALFDDPDVIGARYERPGFTELISSELFYVPPLGGILSAGAGLTTSLPTTATVYPVFGEDAQGPEDLLGYFVGESDLSPDSDFNAEIAQLADRGTQTWRFIDSSGHVVASSEPGELGREPGDVRLTTLDAGLHHVDDLTVVVADVPTSGWQVVFGQDTDEFQQALAGPLQNVGVVVVLLLVGLGVVVVISLSRQLRAAREEQRRLRELSEAQKEFISIVSHELRTPVAGVLGFLQTGLDHWDALSDDERRHTMTRASASARRLHALTRDVLDTQSVESGSLSYAFDDIDLREEVTAAVTAAQAVHAHRPFTVAVPTTPVPVHADADRLQQVLTNLLDNANNNSPPDLPIAVSLEVVEGDAFLSVRDHGPGVDEASRTRIFDKFVRGRASTVTGTGLGLYVSRKIVEAHDGDIGVDNEPDGGARFVVSLPTVDATTLDPPTPTPAEVRAANR